MQSSKLQRELTDGILEDSGFVGTVSLKMLVSLTNKISKYCFTVLKVKLINLLKIIGHELKGKGTLPYL